jgi:hypothetical protein
MMKRQGVEVHLFNNLRIPALTRKPDSKPAGE